MSLFSDTTLFEICLVCLRNCITLVMYTWGPMKGDNIMFHGHLVLNIMHAWTLNRINLLPAFSKNGSHQTKYWQNHSNAYQIRTHKLFFIYRYTQKRKCHIYDISYGKNVQRITIFATFVYSAMLMFDMHTVPIPFTVDCLIPSIQCLPINKLIY